MDPYIEETRDVDKISNRIKKDGVCIIKNYIYSEDLSQVEKEFEDILSSNTHRLDKSDKNKCLREKIKNLSKYKTIHKYLVNTFVKEISDKTWDIWNYDLVFIHKDVQNESTNNVNPHFDFDRKLKFYLCLNDMGLENGCFKILPGKSHLVTEKRKINRRKNIFTPGHNLYNGTEIKMEEMIPVIANGGDLVIFDTNCIHCGGDRFVDGKDRKVIRLHLK